MPVIDISHLTEAVLKRRNDAQCVMAAMVMTWDMKKDKPDNSAMLAEYENLLKYCVDHPNVLDLPLEELGNLGVLSKNLTMWIGAHGLIEEFGDFMKQLVNERP